MNHFPKELAKLKSWIVLLLSLCGMTGLAATPLLFVSFTTPVLAQTQSNKKAEADRLLQQGNQYFYISQYREALQSWQKALEIYRDIGDLAEGEIRKAVRQGEANSLGNLGNAYFFLGEYPKAIDFYQQSLAIKREIGARQGEARSLNNLGNAYFFLGEYPKAECR